MKITLGFILIVSSLIIGCTSNGLSKSRIKNMISEKWASRTQIEVRQFGHSDMDSTINIAFINYIKSGKLCSSTIYIKNKYQINEYFIYNEANVYCRQP